MDKLNNSLKSLQAEFQSITTGMGGFSNATEQTRAKIDVLSRMVDKQKEKIENFNQRIIGPRLKKEKQVNQHSDTPTNSSGNS